MKVYAYRLKLSPSASCETNACTVVLDSKRVRIGDYDVGKYTGLTLSTSVPKDTVATEVQDPSDDAGLFHDLLLPCSLVMESASLPVPKACCGYPRRKASAPGGTRHARVL